MVHWKIQKRIIESCGFAKWLQSKGGRVDVPFGTGGTGGRAKKIQLHQRASAVSEIKGIHAFRPHRNAGLIASPQGFFQPAPMRFGKFFCIRDAENVPESLVVDDPVSGP